MKTGKMTVSLEVHALWSRVDVNLVQGRIAEAVKKFRQVLSIDPEHTEAMAKLAVLAFQAGERGNCIDSLEPAVTIAPRDATLHYRLGLAHFVANHYKRALASLRRTVELDPDNATVQLKLGSVYLAMGDKEQAVEAFQAALHLQPGLLTGQQDPKMPENLRTQVRTANQLINDKYAEMVNVTVKKLGEIF